MVEVLRKVSSEGATCVINIPLPETRWGDERSALDSTSTITRSTITTELENPQLCHRPSGSGSYEMQRNWHSGRTEAG